MKQHVLYYDKEGNMVGNEELENAGVSYKTFSALAKVVYLS